jgi:hypothetical protein
MDIDRAIEWLQKNNEAQMRNSLTLHRPMIVITPTGSIETIATMDTETIIIQKGPENVIFSL